MNFSFRDNIEWSDDQIRDAENILDVHESLLESVSSQTVGVQVY